MKKALAILTVAAVMAALPPPGQVGGQAGRTGGPTAAPPSGTAPAGTFPASGPALVAFRLTLERVMGTKAELTVVAGQDQAELATKTFNEIETVLRDVEKKMSARLEDSELARLNAAPVGQSVALSAEMLAVLARARAFTPQTQGAFDVTCRPILELWRQAGQRNNLPTEREIKQAVEDTGWRWFKLTDAGAVRLKAEASIDLGGIAKKHGIDRATEILAGSGAAGGMINVGGDIRCWGRRAGGGPWRVGVRNPFSDDPEDLLAVVAVGAVSVCTSGNYERFALIGGRRYSHIVDPRTGQPCDAAPSVTVVGPDATTAGLWATALSVLGVEGLKLMPPEAGLEVMLVAGGSPEKARWYRTAGFDRLLVKKPPQPPAQLPATASAPARP